MIRSGLVGLSLATQIFICVFSLQCLFSLILFVLVAGSTTENALDTFVNGARSASHLFSESFSTKVDDNEMVDMLEELELSGRYAYAAFRGVRKQQALDIGPTLVADMIPIEDFKVGTHGDNTYFILIDINNNQGVSGQLILGFDELHVLNEIKNFNQQWLIITILYLFVSAFVIYIVSFTLTISTRALQTSARLIADGVHGTSMQVLAWNKEVSNLSTDLEIMRVRMLSSIRDEERHRSIVENIPLPIATLNNELYIVSCNSAFEYLFGEQSEHFIGSVLTDYIAKSDVKKCESYFKDLHIEKLESIRFSYKNANNIVINLRKKAIKTAHFTYITVTFQALNKTEQYTDTEYLGLYDHLTGLMNRAFLLKSLDFLYEQSASQSQQSALLFIDLDRFKRINDTYGHSMGDLVLQQIAARLTATVRPHDVVSRFGGDEFGILLNHLKSKTSAINIGTKLLNEVSRKVEVENHEFYLGCSIGICSLPVDALTTEDAMKHSDIAMYHAKSKGGNQLTLFNSDLAAEAKKIMNMESCLRLAIPHNEFFLLYQPRVNAKTGLITGCEALIRWESAELKRIVGPNEFIPVAESSGAINELGIWVLREALAQIRRWQTMGIDGCEVSINVSVKQLFDKTLISKLENVLKEGNYAAEAITLEITESTMMEDAVMFEQFFAATKRLGFKLALDDFGTGYSSLSYLSRFKLDQLKIDISFVRNMLASKQDLSLIKAIISLARSLQMETVAEGVETQAQADLLTTENVDCLQGYLYSKAVTADEMAVMLLQQKRTLKRSVSL